ncbi:MAG: Glyoxalase family protein, partial [Akkermansiaceae bacterium]|nr:Glyoxalase family protein [Akkermansiaceae bacterium]
MSDITQTAITSLTIKGAAEALEFYKRAFGAEERYRLEGPGGELMHAEIKIGDSVIMMSDEFPDWGALSPETIGGCPITIVLYVPDADSAQARAIEAGAKERMPVSDQFWGDRMGSVSDPYGFKWSLATHKEVLSPEQIKERFKDFA